MTGNKNRRYILLQFEKCQRILLMRLSSLGDVLLVSPILRLLRNACPKAQIDILTKAQYTDVFRAHPEVSRLLTIPSSGHSLKQTIRSLRSHSYDIAMDLHGKPLTRLLLSLTQSRYKFTYSSQNLKKDLWIHFGWNTFSEITPVPELYAAPLRKLGLKSKLPPLEMYFEPEVIEATKAYIKKELSALTSINSPPLLALAPGARWATKCWPVESFARLAKEASEKMGATLVILGGPSESSLAQKLCDQIKPQVPVINSVGHLSLMESGALLQQCQSLVSNDSGLMHMATALGVPVVAIFGPTAEEFGFYPFQSPSRVVSHPLPCRPCSRQGSRSCPKSHHLCMKEISHQRVFTELQGIWALKL